MRQGTTPPYALTVFSRDLTDKAVFVTLEGEGGVEVTKSGDQLTMVCADNDTVIAFRLTQEETFALPQGRIEVQVRWIDADGHADATEIKAVANLRSLLQEVIRYE